MIVGRGATNDETKQVLLLGVTDDNVKALTSGMPIRVSRETHGPGIPEGWLIVIVHGKTTTELARTVMSGPWAAGAEVHHEPLLDPKKMPGGGG